MKTALLIRDRREPGAFLIDILHHGARERRIAGTVQDLTRIVPNRDLVHCGIGFATGLQPKL
jgi:hypothetical protein